MISNHSKLLIAGLASISFLFLDGCSSTNASDGTGTVVFTDTKMTYFQTGGTNLYSSCGGPASPKPAPTGAYEFEWSLGADGKLVLKELGNSSCVEDPTLASCTKTYDKK